MHIYIHKYNSTKKNECFSLKFAKETNGDRCLNLINMQNDLDTFNFLGYPGLELQIKSILLISPLY